MLGMPGDGDVKNVYSTCAYVSDMVTFANTKRSGPKRTDGMCRSSRTGFKASVMRFEVLGLMTRMRTGLDASADILGGCRGWEWVVDVRQAN